MRLFRHPAPMLLAAALLVFIASVLPACSSPGREESGTDIFPRISEIARPHTFSIARWELQWLLGLRETSPDERSDRLHEQIKTVITDQGIPLLPPLSFTLEEPPHLLVISPRDRIAYADRYLLKQELTADDIEQIESSIAELNMSALVVKLGGFGATYPPIVSDDAGITFTINTIIEEWLHQYLVFKPLGFRYLLDSIGIRQDPQIIIINETLAGMVSNELGDIVRQRHYPETLESKAPAESSFDFDAEMRITRHTVDRYLAQGMVEAAERYMEQQRQAFVENGYRIRKLNQAYFAFHGIYGQDPASVSPAEQDLEELRARSSSLRSFLDQAAGFTSYDDLNAALDG